MSMIEIQDLGDLIFDNSKFLKDNSYKNMLDKLKNIVDTIPTHKHKVYAFLETTYVSDKDEITESSGTIDTLCSFIIILNKQIDHLIQDDIDLSLKVIIQNNIGTLDFKELNKLINSTSQHVKKIQMEINNSVSPLIIENTIIKYNSIESLSIFW